MAAARQWSAAVERARSKNAGLAHLHSHMARAFVLQRVRCFSDSAVGVRALVLRVHACMHIARRLFRGFAERKATSFRKTVSPDPKAPIANNGRQAKPPKRTTL